MAAHLYHRWCLGVFFLQINCLILPLSAQQFDSVSGKKTTMIYRMRVSPRMMLIKWLWGYTQDLRILPGNLDDWFLSSCSVDLGKSTLIDTPIYTVAMDPPPKRFGCPVVMVTSNHVVVMMIIQSGSMAIVIVIFLATAVALRLQAAGSHQCPT